MGLRRLHACVQENVLIKKLFGSLNLLSTRERCCGASNALVPLVRTEDPKLLKIPKSPVTEVTFSIAMRVAIRQQSSVLSEPNVQI